MKWQAFKKTYLQQLNSIYSISAVHKKYAKKKKNPFTVNQSLTGKHLKGWVAVKKWEGKQSENTEGCQITQELN